MMLEWGSTYSLPKPSPKHDFLGRKGAYTGPTALWPALPNPAQTIMVKDLFVCQTPGHLLSPPQSNFLCYHSSYPIPQDPLLSPAPTAAFFRTDFHYLQPILPISYCQVHRPLIFQTLLNLPALIS